MDRVSGFPGYPPISSVALCRGLLALIVVAAVEVYGSTFTRNLRLSKRVYGSFQEASTVTGSLPSNCKGTVCTVGVIHDSTKLRTDRELETFRRLAYAEAYESTAQSSARLALLHQE